MYRIFSGIKYILFYMWVEFSYFTTHHLATKIRMFSANKINVRKYEHLGLRKHDVIPSHHNRFILLKTNKNFNCSEILVCEKKKNSGKLLGQLNIISVKKNGGLKKNNYLIYENSEQKLRRVSTIRPKAQWKIKWKVGNMFELFVLKKEKRHCKFFFAGFRKKFNRRI